MDMTAVKQMQDQLAVGIAPEDALFCRSRIEATAAGDGRTAAAGNLDTILRIPVLMQVVLGSASMPVSNLMKLGRGAIVPLDHRVGEPVDVVVNGRTIARGEVVVMEDDNSRFGIALTEIVATGSEKGG